MTPPPPPDVALAVDVGGTTVKAELVDRAGAVVASGRCPTPTGGEAAGRAIAELGSGLLTGDVGSTGAVVGAGVVVPGLVDRSRGVATYSANIGWRDLELAALLGSAWGIPVSVANDVAAGGVAEHRLGAGRGEDDLVFVPIGTGIAAAVVSGGRLLSGPGGEIAEIGHVVVRPGTRCACGGDGCLEAVASASAIGRRYSALTGQDGTGADEVAARVATDPVAAAVWQDAVEALADGLLTLSLVTAPALVVVGGGLSHAGDVLLEPLRAALKARYRVVDPPRVVTGAYGERAGVVGAGLLAFDGWSAKAPS